MKRRTSTLRYEAPYTLRPAAKKKAAAGSDRCYWADYARGIMGPEVYLFFFFFAAFLAFFAGFFFFLAGISVSFSF